MKSLKIFLLPLLLFLVQGHALAAQPLRVAVAADLKPTMTEIVTAFEKANPGSYVEVISGSSGKFFQQIVNGAPFDIYFSADIEYPKKLKERGWAISEVQPYAIGRLVLWSGTLSVAGGVGVLADDQFRKIAIANPEHAPYGQRARESIIYYGLLDKVTPKLAFGETVAQAAQFAATGAADAAIIALSLALTPEMQGKGSYFLIDERSHSPLEQGYAVLKHAAGNPDAAKFDAYVASGEARAIFRKYGFRLPGETP